MGLTSTTVILVATKTAILVFGSALTYLSYSAFKRTNSRSLRALATGIGLLTIGAMLGGVLHQLVGIGLDVSVSIQGVFTAMGLAIMTYSLFTGGIEEPGRTDSGMRTGD